MTRAARDFLALGVLAVLTVMASSRPEGSLIPIDPVRDPSSMAQKFPSESSDLRDFLIEDLKLNILRGLKLSSPPTEILNETHLSHDVIELLQEDKEVSRTDQKENLIVHANNRDFSCSMGNETRCRKFEFNISSDLESVITVYAWFHKIRSFERLSISVYSSVSVENEPLVKLKEDPSKKKTESGWVTFELPKILALQPKDHHLLCIVEIDGADVHTDGDQSPFLVLTKHTGALERKRRNVIPSSNENCTCCAENHHITLEDIGWQNWVHSPKDFNIKICRGQCSENLSSFTINYQRIISAFYKINKSQPKPKCNFWAPRCEPDSYSPLRMMYKDKDGNIHDQEIANMVIHSCRCM